MKGEHYLWQKGCGVQNALISAALVALLSVFGPVAATTMTSDQSPTPAESPSPTQSSSATNAASPAPSTSDASSASPAPQPDDTTAAARAKEWLGRLQKGQLDRAQLTPDLSAGLQDATVQALSKQIPNGTPQRIVLRAKQQMAGNTTWTFRVSWPDQTLDYTFGVENVTGKISALYLRPGAA